MILAPTPFRRWTPVATTGAVLAALLFAGSAHAAGSADRGLRTDRAAATRALDRAQALAHGHGVKTGREMTGALRELALREPALSAADDKQAQSLLGRPTDGNDTQQPGGPYTADEIWSAHDSRFCYHWVRTTADAPPLADSDGNQIPNYVENMAEAFETSFATENDTLGWTTPVADGIADNCTGGENLTDIYIKQIGNLGLYGYASIDPGQNGQRRHAFQVMDNDYSAAEFPQYNGDPNPPMQVTAAHEYNHILQYAYDILEDKWMFESTATWMEDKVFPSINDYHQYLDPWSQLSQEPLTAPDNDKIYGSAIWNHWLDEHIGPQVVQDAWVSSIPNDSFAPGAYDSAIRDAGGPGFAPVFIDFAVATAEWDATNSGIHEGASFPAMARVTSNHQPVVVPTDGSVLSGALDHTGYALFDVQPSTAGSLTLTGSLPDGTMGAFALVGRRGNTMDKVVGQLPNGGQTDVTLPNPGQYTRITAVAINADPSQDGFDGQDWHWTKDQQEIQLAVSEGSGTPGGGGNPGGGGTPGGGTPGGGGGVIHLPGGGGNTPPTAGTLTLAGATAKLGKVGKSGILRFTATVSGAGRVSAKATVDKKTAKRLHLGRKAVTIGKGSAAAAGSGPVTVKLKLTGKAKKRLKKQHKAVKVAVKVTFTPASGAPTTRTVTLTLKP
jgi:hypothetical protein